MTDVSRGNSQVDSQRFTRIRKAPEISKADADADNASDADADVVVGVATYREFQNKFFRWLNVKQRATETRP